MTSITKLVIFFLWLSQLCYTRKLDYFDSNVHQISDMNNTVSKNSLQADVNKNGVFEFFEWSKMKFQKFTHGNKEIILQLSEFNIGNKKSVTNKIHKGYSINLVPDLSEEKIMIPETKFECNSDNSCILINDSTSNCTYMDGLGNWEDCQHAKTILRTNNRTKIPEKIAETQ